MSTAVKQTNTPTADPLLTEAFEALQEKLGTEKALHAWQLLTPSHRDYAQIRHTLFTDMDADALDAEIKKFNRKPQRKA